MMETLVLSALTSLWEQKGATLKTSNFNIAFFFFFLPLLVDVGPLVLLELLFKPCDQVFLKMSEAALLCLHVSLLLTGFVSTQSLRFGAAEGSVHGAE